ncbi:MAG: ATP-binding protein [Candidatus Binatia bacterium]
MSGETGRRQWRSTRQRLIGRLQVILLICASMAPIFAARDLFDASAVGGAQLPVKLVGSALALLGYFTLRWRWTVRHAWPVTIGIVVIAYSLTALSGIVSPSGEYETTAVLFAGAALTTATLLPWGTGPQLGTATFAGLLLAAGVWLRDGDLGLFTTDSGIAVLLALALSVATARKLQVLRLAHRGERRDRWRAEAAVRRLNAHLEQRVALRTSELEATNRRLEDEIVERQRAAEALRASQAQLADVVDHSTALVSLKDRGGRYVLVNREFERLVERPRAAILGNTDDDLFPATLAERLAARDAEVLGSGEPVSFEQELGVAADGRVYVVVKFPLRGSGEAIYGVGSMATDITPLKQLQEALRRHQDELAHALRLHTIGEMAAALAHEINQPLCAVTNYAQGGAQRLRAGAVDAPTLLHAFEQIASEGLRATQILRSIRTLVRRQSAEESAVDVNALASDAVRILEPQARLHGVIVRLEGGAGLPLVQANPTQIEQVMINLMLNGVQAIAGAAGQRREVVVATGRSGDHVEVTVSDTGAGIAPTVAKQLFAPFVTTKASGLGLGLAISRSIIEDHGGRLWASPHRGAGATFRFSLPIDGADSLTRGN